MVTADKYTSAVTAIPGFEDIAAAEVEELIGAKATAAAGVVVFQVSDLADLCRLCYLSQSASSVLFLLSQFAVAKTAAATAENLKKSLRGADFKAWFQKGATFKVAFQPCAAASHDFSSSEIEAEAGAVIAGCVKSSTGFAPKVDLKLPAVTVAVYGNGSSGFCGIAINPFDLSKREYRIFSHSSDIKGNLAYSLLRAAGYGHGKFLFDPFTRAGTVAIEAAIFSSGFPVNYYRKESISSHLSRLPPFSNIGFTDFFSAVEKDASAAAEKRLKKAKPKILSSSPLMQYVRSAEKNAKIAGVNKLMRFSRLDIEWLDAKLDERSVDLIASYPPQFKSVSGNDAFAAAENRKLAALYKNFFYHADFFLKKKGEIVLLLKKGSYGEITAAAATYKFAARVLRSFKLGSEEFELVVFKKQAAAAQA